MIDKSFISFKDWLWKPIVEDAIKRYNLYDFDVFHFESGMDFLKQEEKSKNISEDESKKLSNDLQKITDDFVKKVEDKIKEKEEEILKV